MGRVEIIERLEKAKGPDRELDIAICLHLNYIGAHQIGTVQNLRRADPDDDYLDYECYDDGGTIPECTDRAPEMTGSLDAAIALVEKMLPGWWWQIGSCHVSDDARLCPDFNHPVHCERLMREFGQVVGDPSVYWQEVTDVDLRPAGLPAIALLIALFKALDSLPQDGGGR